MNNIHLIKNKLIIKRCHIDAIIEDFFIYHKC